MFFIIHHIRQQNGIAYTIRCLVLSALLLVLSNHHAFCQIGIPTILNFLKSDYQGGTENYEISQSTSGEIVVANNNGLLIYDGSKWRCVPLSNRTILRSIEWSDGRLYAGGQNELGYFAKDHHDEWIYSSLTEKVPEEIQLEDIWDISNTGNGLLCRTSTAIFRIIDDDVQTVVGDVETFSSWYENDQYYVNLNDGLHRLMNDSLTKVLDWEGLIQGIIIRDDQSIVWVSESRGLINEDGNSILNETSALLSEVGVNSVEEYKDGYLICTKESGLIVLDNELRLKKQYDVESGLQRNFIHAVHIDRNNNLWLATSNGVDYIQENTSLTFVHPDGNLQGAGFAYAEFSGKKYFGTSNGLFHIKDNERIAKFELVKGTKGQVWGLFEGRNELFIAHANGVFVLGGDGELEQVEEISGSWIFLPVEGSEDHYVVGHYRGISVLEKKAGSWAIASSSEELTESCRIGVLDSDGNYWFSHPYRGVWKFGLNSETKEIEGVSFYDQQKGFPSELHIHVARVSNQVWFTAEKGLYRYDPATDRVVSLSKDFEHIHEDERVLRIFPVGDNQIWMVKENGMEVLDIRESALSKEVVVHTIDGVKERMVAGFESLNKTSDDALIVGVEDGFALIENDALISRAHEKPVLRVSVFTNFDQQDSLLYSHFESEMDSTSFNVPSELRRLKFEFGTTSFHLKDIISYQLMLEGLDEEWFESDTYDSKEYTNLPAGDYVFKLRAVNSSGETLSEKNVRFNVLPAWYASRTAKLIWFFLGGLALVLLILLPQNRFAKEKKAIVDRKEEEITMQKQEAAYLIDRMKHEKLSAELNYKNKELASVTMHLVQKGEILQDIMKSLKQIDLQDTEASQTEIRKLVKIIRADVRLDNNWDQFERHFDQVHVDFMKRLKGSYPKLTPNDHKLCAYLRMNLSSKEIATIMNISVRGVEISRYRLRRKFEIPTETNLTSYIQSI